MSKVDDLLRRLPGGHIIAKDLAIARSTVQGNAYCRYNTETGERKYCSRSLFEDSETKYVIPETSRVPVPLVNCECCGNESWREDDDSCGTCGKPMFDCPACGDEVHGMPDYCPCCHEDYVWGDE